MDTATIIGGVEYRAVRTRAEREEAYRLIYESYLRKGYVAPNLGRIRFDKYMAGDETITFIALYHKTMIATMTLFMDGKEGLPIDEVFREDVRRLRLRWSSLAARKVAEVGALALRPDDSHRGSEVFMALARMCGTYAIIHGVTDCLITISPRHQDIYLKVFGFEPFAGERGNAAAKNIPALAYCLTQEKLDAAKPKFRWFFSGPLIKVPESAPVFSREDKAYFYSLVGKSSSPLADRVFHHGIKRDTQPFRFVPTLA